MIVTSLPSGDALDAAAAALRAGGGLVDVVIEASTLGIEDKERARDLARPYRDPGPRLPYKWDGRADAGGRRRHLRQRRS